jgi:hypothetical protein
MRQKAQKTSAAHQHKTTTEVLTVGGKKPGIFGQMVISGGGVQVPSRLAKQPGGLGLDGFCGATTLPSSGRKMLENEKR